MGHKCNTEERKCLHSCDTRISLQQIKHEPSGDESARAVTLIAVAAEDESLKAQPQAKSKRLYIWTKYGLFVVV